MKKTTLATTIIFVVLCLTVVGTQTVEVSKANPISSAVIVSVYSPANLTYASNSLVLNFTVHFTATDEKLIKYSLDGKDNVTLTETEFAEFEKDGIYEEINITKPLPLLSEGSHQLDIFASPNQKYYLSPDNKTVFFTVDTIVPKITFLPIENLTYNSIPIYNCNLIPIPLNFTLDEPASWMGYSLDAQANVTLSGNTTITGVSGGVHRIVVYANDTAGNMGRSEFSFIVDTATPYLSPSPSLTQNQTTEQSSTPSPTTTEKGPYGLLSDFQLILIIIGSIATAIIIGVGVALKIKYKKNKLRN